MSYLNKSRNWTYEVKTKFNDKKTRERKTERTESGKEIAGIKIQIRKRQGMKQK